MRDGVRLSADVYLPAAGGPFPTIVTRTPYESARDVFIENGFWWARRGYAFVVQDCRGRFESEGVFHTAAYPSHLRLPVAASRAPESPLSARHR